LPDFGTLKVNLPIISMGDGRPKVTIIAGMHGNERTGLLVMKSLFQSLNLTKGQIDFIPSANPMAQALIIRDFPNMLDGHTNLNRNFPGKENDEYGLINAKKLTETVKDSDLVIDLHTFSLPCPIVAILADGPEEVLDKSRELIKLLGPDIIWRVNTEKKHEQEFTGTLGCYLHQQGINFIGIELPKIFRVKESQINRVIEGINRILSHLGMQAELPIKPNNEIPIYDRFPYVRSLKSGLFTASKKLLDSIKSGEVVGELLNLYNFSTEPVISPYDGKIIILLDQDFVRTGDKLFSVAQEIS
ncbi:MAG TPA: succinylglutamate desuccinylase/aspartoacylase family protein, partial [Patescibacteria group bacterium]|nr:succinylglutamate desuccinylase/aspartoacylase family protein [Patescibacteria group bacterium]